MAKKENNEPQTEQNTAPDAENLNPEVQDSGTQESVSESADEKRYAELNDKYIRLYSDFDNFRKRTLKERADLISSAGADILKDLLVVLDDFDRAVANNEKVEDPNVLKEGFKLIQQKMVSILQSKGLEFTEAKGEVFDADKHEAITNVPVTDESQKGKVIDVVEKGYNLRGKALRFAKVVVGQ